MCHRHTPSSKKRTILEAYSLNLRQLIIFMFLYGWFFISYQTQIFACDPSRINWTATGAFPGGFADDDDEYSAEALDGKGGEVVSSDATEAGGDGQRGAGR